MTAKLVDDVLSHAIDSNAIQTSQIACEDTLEDVFVILKSPLLKVLHYVMDVIIIIIIIICFAMRFIVY